MISDLAWQLFAKVVALPRVTDYLIKRAQRTPYFNLEGYMDRWWLFNAYGSDVEVPEDKRHRERKYRWLPSIRVHHILREDLAPDMHDHPWNARTIILKGWYIEERLLGDKVMSYFRCPGDTATLNYGEYHNIKEVSLGGVWTMFFTWDYKGPWGFLVNGKKMPWREYEGRTREQG